LQDTLESKEEEIAAFRDENLRMLTVQAKLAKAIEEQQDLFESLEEELEDDVEEALRDLEAENVALFKSRDTMIADLVSQIG
jgi:hypothetical protein